MPRARRATEGVDVVVLPGMEVRSSLLDTEGLEVVVVGGRAVESCVGTGLPGWAAEGLEVVASGGREVEVAVLLLLVGARGG